MIRSSRSCAVPATVEIQAATMANSRSRGWRSCAGSERGPVTGIIPVLGRECKVPDPAMRPSWTIHRSTSHLSIASPEPQHASTRLSGEPAERKKL